MADLNYYPWQQMIQRDEEWQSQEALSSTPGWHSKWPLKEPWLTFYMEQKHCRILSWHQCHFFGSEHQIRRTVIRTVKLRGFQGSPKKAFYCVDHNKLWKILKERRIPDHLICLLRNLYVGQEATVRTGHGTTDWFQIGKGVRQGCILSPCLFNLYEE